MTQRRKRTLQDLKRTWNVKRDADHRETAQPTQKPENLAGSHTSEQQNDPQLPRLQKTHTVERVVRPETQPPKKTKRVYLNVVLTWELEKRLERAVKFYQRSHGKAFGRSAYGRKALLAQLERDGF